MWDELPGAAHQAQREQCDCIREKATSFPSQSPPAFVPVKVQIGFFHHGLTGALPHGGELRCLDTDRLVSVSTAQLWTARLGNALQSPDWGAGGFRGQRHRCLKEVLWSDGVAKYLSFFHSRAPLYQQGRQVGPRGTGEAV